MWSRRRCVCDAARAAAGACVLIHFWRGATRGYFRGRLSGILLPDLKPFSTDDVPTAAWHCCAGADVLVCVEAARDPRCTPSLRYARPAPPTPTADAAHDRRAVGIRVTPALMERLY